VSRALIVVLVIVLAPQVARADLAAEARFHDEQAHAHYDAGRFDDALREFFLEQRIAPNPRILFNIGLCFERLHRVEDAFMIYGEYAASEDRDTERRTYVDAALARIAPTVATVRVESDPVGATIYVDDRAHGAYGVTPHVLALSPGAHRIWLDLAAHRTVELSVAAVRGSEVTARGSLERIVGTLHVDAEPSTAIDVLDGTGASVAAGPAPLDARIPPGTYSVDATSERGRPFHTVVTVEADATRTLAIALEPLPEETGDVTVTSSVAGAVVQLDDEAAGFTPVVLSGISLGPHTLTVGSEGLAEWSDTVDVEADVRTWLTVQLVAPSATTRSDWTWVLGGVAGASLVAWAGLVGASVSTHDELQSVIASGGTTGPSVRDRGMGIDAAADAVLTVGLVSLAAAILTYFLTEHTETHASSASVARQAR
jgi:hypothetical protein